MLDQFRGSKLINPFAIRQCEWRLGTMSIQPYQIEEIGQFHVARWQRLLCDANQLLASRSDVSNSGGLDVVSSSFNLEKSFGVGKGEISVEVAT